MSDYKTAVYKAVAESFNPITSEVKSNDTIC